MGNNAVKTIVLLMVLVVLSFIIGAQVSDSMKDSFGAFAIIGAIIGGGFLIYMGPRVWQLLFILPPFMPILPLPLPHLNEAISQCNMAPCYVGSVVMVYWIVLCSLGRVRIRWRWAAILDIPFWIFVGFLVVAFIRFPVALNAMNLDYDAIGGEEVVILFFVLFLYVCFSMIPITKQELEKVLPLAFKLFFVAQAILIVRGVMFGGIAAAEGDGKVSRFYFLYPAGSTLFFWMYSKYPIGRILASFRCWAISLFGLVSAFSTGQRQNVALLATGIVYIAAVKRELLVLISALVVAYIGVMSLSELDLLIHMPGNLQRTLASVPGVKVDGGIAFGAKGTMETRRKLRECALNPHTGVIKDYMWGDGFAISRAYINRGSVAAMRGTGRGTQDYEGMCIVRNFHNGALHTLSRIGYVGLAWCGVVCIVAWCVSIQVLRAWLRTDTYPYIVVGIINMPIILLTYVYANYVTKHFMLSLQSYFFLKLCYCIARENGMLRPLFLQQYYVPLMIQEHENSVAKAA